MSDNVKVAVRVRPFNRREKDRNAQLCIEMKGAQTIIRGDAGEKKFTFDYSYWSHDGFEEREDGLLVPTSPKYADQQRVFEDLGQLVLENAWEGYNCSLFAYGQTGSGKSYSMVGYGVNRGIVPISCEDLFRRMQEQADNPMMRFKVSFSMLEIYNEQVRDLLTTKNKQGGLSVREDPSQGRFVVRDLKNAKVESYRDIEHQIEIGTRNRTVASTNMNSTSSRAHTIICITFEKITKDPDSGQEMSKRSEINLVDLAGSERADSTGATGERLKEGSNINKSLSTLGNVIAALAENRKGAHIPYRDSVLTKLLKNALGGNSKTIMIAALSPASINYDETLSTLRYADRAKQIKNKAVVNESPTEKLIRELKEQVEALKAQLGGNIPAAPGGDGAASVDVEALRRQMEEEIRLEMEALSKEMAFQEDRETGSREEADAQHAELEAAKRKQATVCHFINLNEDPALDRVIRHFVEGDTVMVGKWSENQNEAEKPDVVLSGLSIRKHHAKVLQADGKITIEPGSAVAETKVNGVKIDKPTDLRHNDRVLFGTNNLFLFINPQHPEPSEGTPETVDYDFAQSELARASGFDMDGKDPDEQQRIEALLEMLPMIAEVNAISDEMQKAINFEVALVSSQLLDTTGLSRTHTTSTQVMIKGKERETGNEWLLDRGEFVERRFRMQEIYQEWSYDPDQEAPQFGPAVDATDPFYLEHATFVVGVSAVFVKHLAHALDFDGEYDIIDYQAQPQGKVEVSFTPCMADGAPLADDFDLEDPSDLIGQAYYIKVDVRSASVMQAKFSNALAVRVLFGTYDQFETSWVTNSANPSFNFSHVVRIPEVTAETIEWMENGFVKMQILSKHRPKQVKSLGSKSGRAPSKSDLLNNVKALEQQAQEKQEAEQRLRDQLKAADDERQKLHAQLDELGRTDDKVKVVNEALLSAESRSKQLQIECDEMRERLSAEEAKTAKQNILLARLQTQVSDLKRLCTKWSQMDDLSFQRFWNEVTEAVFQDEEAPRLKAGALATAGVAAASSGNGSASGAVAESNPPPAASGAADKSGVCAVM